MNTKRLLRCAGTLLLAVITIGRTFAAELDMGSPVGRTPYDPYLEPLWKVFGQLGGNQPDLDLVEQLCRESRGFRYVFKKEQPYVPQLPEVTEAIKAGDCKAKSLWLASRMNTRSLRFVIGKFRVGDAQSHAWLIWQGPEGWFVLDATNYSKPLAPDRLSATQLVPTFSYSPGGKFAHASTAAAHGAKYGDHL